jgi:hypothetical protein
MPLKNQLSESCGQSEIVISAIDSTAVQQKYQGLLITESKLNIGGSELPPG